MAIRYAVRDGIAYIEFCRPDKHNALRNEDISDLSAALFRLDRDGDAAVAILSGQGRSFSSGADVTDRLQASLDVGSMARLSDERETFLHAGLWKPVIAAVHGYCFGHAVATALLCDVVVAARSAVFQLTEITFGLAPYRMWGAVAASNPTFATDVALTGRRFTGEDAWKAGIVTRLSEDGQHIAEAEQMARQIIANPQAGVREMVRIRRNLLAEQDIHLRAVAGDTTRAWLDSTEARDHVSARTAGNLGSDLASPGAA